MPEKEIKAQRAMLGSTAHGTGMCSVWGASLSVYVCLINETAGADPMDMVVLLYWGSMTNM